MWGFQNVFERKQPQLYMDCCVVRMLYTKFMVATNHTPVIDTQKMKGKDPSLTLNKVINCKGREEEREREEPQTQPEGI